MNNYHIYETIGRGKHSVVYKGRKKKTIQYFAVKSVEKLQKPKVLQEVRTLHSLEHENVLRFHAWYETSNHLWLILEYCVGGDLLTILHQDTRLPEETIHNFARDLVKALQYLHSNGVVYCDLKPSNILLDENGRLKLCDFELARRLCDIQKLSLQQLPQAKRGTPCYMAPELFQEGAVHSFASDMWAVGCVLYECATGQPPYVSSSFTQLVSAILEAPLPPLPAFVSPEFADFVQRLLVKDPAHRISWPELRVHPFWRVPTKELPLPEQPAFDHFLQQRRAAEAVSLPPLRGATPPVVSGGAEKAGGEGAGSRVTALPELAGAQRPGLARKGGDVNVHQLSQIVQKNFRREADRVGYRQGGEEGGAHSDVRLGNNDIEIDLAEEGAEGGEDEGDDTSSVVEPAAAAESVKMPLSREDSSALNTDRLPAGGTPEPHWPDDTAPLSARTGSIMSAGGSGDSRRGPLTPVESPDDPSSNDVESAVQQVAQSQLLWHQLDLAVEPIVHNRRIEKVREPAFNPLALLVEPLSGAALAQAPPDQSEAFLARVMASISGATSLNEKLNTLSYVETLATEMDAANHLISSQLMPLLVRMLKTSKPPGLRAKVASAMGILVRHATVIDGNLAASGIVPILTEAAKDKQERVKRRAIASLGELLFYIATPRKAANTSPAWEVPEIAFTGVGSMLRRGEDEVAQHYAVKTIENMASQGGAWASKFASGETVANLAFIFQNSKLEQLRDTAGSCLVRLARFHPPVLPAALEKLGVRALVRGLAEGSSKAQQAYLNLLNMGLQAGVRIGATRLQTQLMAEERRLVPTLVGLLQHASEVLRAKALVAGWALCQASTRWLVALCNAKVTSVLERLARDRDEYVQRCLEAFLSLVAAMALPILDQARAELSKLVAKQGRATPSASPQTPPPGPRGPLGQAAVLLHLVTCQLIRSRFADGRLLSLLGVCLARSQDALVALDASPSNSPRAPEDGPAPGPASPLALVAEFQSVVLQILEALSQGQTPTVLGQKEATVHQVLPVLAELCRASRDGDRRFMCLKVFCDTLLLLLDSTSAPPQTPGSPTPPQGTPVGRSQIDALVFQHFLPLYPSLLQDEEPIPTYAQKLLALLLDRQCVRITDLLQLKLLPRLFDFLGGDPETINIFALKLCLAAVLAPEVPTWALSEARVCARLGLLLQDVAGQGKDDFVKPVVATCHGFLERHAAGQGRGGGVGIQDIAELALSTDVFLALVGSHEDSVADAASHCVALLSVAAPRSTGGTLLQNVPQVLQVLETANMCQSKALLTMIQHRLLTALREACKQQRPTMGPSSFDMSNMEQLETLTARLQWSTSISVTQAANELASELRNDTGPGWWEFGATKTDCVDSPVLDDSVDFLEQLEDPWLPGTDSRPGTSPNTFSEKVNPVPVPEDAAAHRSETEGRVVLYDSRELSAQPAPLTLQSPLEAGLSIVLYYPSDNDALALQESVRSSLDDILDPTSYEIEHATSASSVVYLYTLRPVDDCDIKRLMDAIAEKSRCDPTVTVSNGCEAWAVTRQSQGDRWTLSRIENPPTIDLVFYYASVKLRLEHDHSEFLVAHGINLERHSDLRLKWRAKGLRAKPYDVDLIHEETLEEVGVSYLIEEPESVAMLLPESSGNIIYLECWLGIRSVGRRVAINPAEWSFLGGQITDPKKWTCEVFISHAGSEKNLANTLQRAVRRIGLRPFFDLISLKGTMGNSAILDAAAITAPVGVLLLSPSFFERKWPLRELVNIVRAETHLPVWIGSNFEELKASLEKRPVQAELSDAEWDDLVDKLKDTTTIIQGSQFVDSFMDTILFEIVARCHKLCVELGNQDVYNSMQLQRFRDRVLKAITKILEDETVSLPLERAKQAEKWREALKVLNEDQ